MVEYGILLIDGIGGLAEGEVFEAGWGDGDGSAELAKKLGLERDLTSSGMGLRMRRFSMLVEDGVVKELNLEAPGKFDVSDGATMLKQLG